MTDLPAHTRKAVRAGPLGQSFLSTVSRARIASVFERSLYLEGDGRFICLGGEGIGDGPINLIVENPTRSWIAASVVDSEVLISPTQAQSPIWTLTFDQLATWQPPPWPAAPISDVLSRTLATAIAIAHDMNVSDGLLPLVATTHRTPTSPLDRLAAPRIHHLAGWLQERLTHSDRTSNDAPTDLLGLGPGLTPSGDDLLCGCLIALSAVETETARRTRAVLASAIEQQSNRLTSPLSRQFLNAASQGLGGAALHDFICAMLAADLATLRRTFDRLADIGHTSGLDASAGVLLTLSAYAAASRDPRSPS